MPRDCAVQLRAHGTVYPGAAQLDGKDNLTIRLTEPAKGVAAGQIAVL